MLPVQESLWHLTSTKWGSGKTYILTYLLPSYGLTCITAAQFIALFTSTFLIRFRMRHCELLLKHSVLLLRLVWRLKPTLCRCLFYVNTSCALLMCIFKPHYYYRHRHQFLKSNSKFNSCLILLFVKFLVISIFHFIQSSNIVTQTRTFADSTFPHNSVRT